MDPSDESDGKYFVQPAEQPGAERPRLYFIRSNRVAENWSPVYYPPVVIIEREDLI